MTTRGTKAAEAKPAGSILRHAPGSQLLSASVDFALVVDESGIVSEVFGGLGVELDPGWKKLIGERWLSKVTSESRLKGERLLRDARQAGVGRSAEMNFLVDGVGEVPLRVSSVKFDEGTGTVLILARDLRPLANLQQQMVAAQQAMEREYTKLRQADTRYRVLFHVTGESVLVVNASTRRIVEANPAAATLLGDTAHALEGALAADLFDQPHRASVDAFITRVESGGRAEPKLSATIRGTQVQVAGTVFRQSGSTLVLLRFWEAATPAASRGERTSRMMAVLEALPDGIVVTGPDYKILHVNEAVSEMLQLQPSEIVGQSLDTWLGRAGVDMNLMAANLKEHGSFRAFNTILRVPFGPPLEAIVTGVSALDGKVPTHGFSIRVVSSRLAVGDSTMLATRSLQQLKDLVGRVALKELVRESADLIERMCIEAALEVSGNNRASAAQLLGLSRQTLYSKLRRHGLAEFDPE
jgi:transcriptional regulator PpsR